jgi:hypothetical protein
MADIPKFGVWFCSNLHFFDGETLGILDRIDFIGRV